MSELLSKFELRPARPLVCLEVNPPRGTDLSAIFKRLDTGLEGIDLFNVTDSALARMKLAALPFAAMLKNRYGIEVLVNMSCRDRNLLALQSDLLAGWVMGVRSVVALTGDAMTIGDSPDRKGVFEVNSLGLLQAIATLNGGRDLAGNELKGGCSYLPGVVVNPNARNVGAELKRLKRKKEAGACYALSQPVFDTAQAVTFLQQAAEQEIPIFLGLLPLKDKRSAHAVNNIPGMKMPEPLLAAVDALADGDVAPHVNRHLLEIVEQTSALVAGFHVVSGTAPVLALEFARALSGQLRAALAA